MQPVPVTLRSRDRTVPPHHVQGYAPDSTSPLAVTRFALYDRDAKAWREDEAEPGYMLTHRATGFSLGFGLVTGDLRIWDTLQDAYAALLRCDPAFPAWVLAGTDERARAACRVKFKWACAA